MRYGLCTTPMELGWSNPLLQPPIRARVDIKDHPLTEL